MDFILLQNRAFARRRGNNVCLTSGRAPEDPLDLNYFPWASRSLGGEGGEKEGGEVLEGVHFRIKRAKPCDSVACLPVCTEDTVKNVGLSLLP